MKKLNLFNYATPVSDAYYHGATKSICNLATFQCATTGHILIVKKEPIPVDEQYKFITPAKMKDKDLKELRTICYPSIHAVYDMHTPMLVIPMSHIKDLAKQIKANHKAVAALIKELKSGENGHVFKRITTEDTWHFGVHFQADTCFRANLMLKFLEAAEALEAKEIFVSDNGKAIAESPNGYCMVMGLLKQPDDETWEDNTLWQRMITDYDLALSDDDKEQLKNANISVDVPVDAKYAPCTGYTYEDIALEYGYHRIDTALRAAQVWLKGYKTEHPEKDHEQILCDCSNTILNHYTVGATLVPDAPGFEEILDMAWETTDELTD